MVTEEAGHGTSASPRRGGPDHRNEHMRPIGTNCFGICADGVSVETGKSHRAVVMRARERATRTGPWRRKTGGKTTAPRTDT